ncbi:uncharacterized protein LOC108670173 [Hyalella azteca]|uniref:Uncharacterized protein LOC108670173 n=1 Tax=Hyalella azteca TaxID=294128 RepID=A0A8B7NHL3_HYAAZ|nr:uncharacterized protein LOC108670173 [Hyalella azteca]
MLVAAAPPQFPKARGIATQATQARGVATQATQARGVATQARGVATQATQARGVATQATQARGVATQATQARGVETKSPALPEAQTELRKCSKGLPHLVLLLVVASLAASSLPLAVASSLARQRNNYYHITVGNTSVEMSCSEPINSLNCACPQVLEIYNSHPFSLRAARNVDVYNDRDAVMRHCCNHRHCCAAHLKVFCDGYRVGWCDRTNRPPITYSTC